MNIELKPIAESKVRQLGGDVCGVLVRTEDSEVMAVSEHGRCTRLDAAVMGPADPVGMSERELFEQRFPVPAGIYWNDISEQYDALPGAAGFDDVEIYHGQWVGWQAARAQSGQGVEPVAYVSPALHGSKLTFEKPEPPEGWEDYADSWYCRPLVYADTHPQPARQGVEALHSSQIRALRRNVSRNCGPQMTALLDQLIASQPQPAQHPDDEAVDRFAQAMKSKLAKKRGEGRGGWEDKRVCPTGTLQQMLIDHLEKGDPVDIGNFSMMIWNRGEAVAGQPAQQGSVPEGWRELVNCVQSLVRQKSLSDSDTISVGLWKQDPDKAQFHAQFDFRVAHFNTTPQPEGDGCGEVQEVANKVCGELPEGWIINLSMENGAAWVEAIKPSGYTVEIDGADMTLVEQINEAMRFANNQKRAGGEQ